MCARGFRGGLRTRLVFAGRREGTAFAGREDVDGFPNAASLDGKQFPRGVFHLRAEMGASRFVGRVGEHIFIHLPHDARKALRDGRGLFLAVKLYARNGLLLRVRDRGRGIGADCGG